MQGRAFPGFPAVWSPSGLRAEWGAGSTVWGPDRSVSSAACVDAAPKPKEEQEVAVSGSSASQKGTVPACGLEERKVTAMQLKSASPPVGNCPFLPM